jgi:hypothetical protein
MWLLAIQFIYDSRFLSENSVVLLALCVTLLAQKCLVKDLFLC